MLFFIIGIYIRLFEEFIFQCGNVVLIDCFDVTAADIPCGCNRLNIFGNTRLALLQLQVGGFGQFVRFFQCRRGVIA